ncbi:hypothetical protein [Psittacicella gerlachiana]|uniref:Uncharacterized protein n=1 Tax=Psittacicella gerlachiana TaxID=2028574 RepID=A0A3A1YLU8_9GAMM|nr:hypothetical protein [Psittacicella gerlachiana]RIY37960.1 hypothetical protein CKF59_01050 [Psittacicella gerlachiana]
MSITDEFALKRMQTTNAYAQYALDSEQILQASHLTHDFYNLKFFNLSYETTFSYPTVAVYCFNQEMPNAFYIGDTSNFNTMTFKAFISSYHFLILYLAEVLGRNKKYPLRRGRIIYKLLASYNLHSQSINNPYNLFAPFTAEDYQELKARLEARTSTRASIILDKYNNPDIPAFAQTHAFLNYAFAQLEHEVGDDQEILDNVYTYLMGYDFMGVSFGVMLALMQYTEHNSNLRFPEAIFEFTHEGEYREFVNSFFDSYAYTIGECMNRSNRDNQEQVLQIVRQWLSRDPEVDYLTFMRQTVFPSFEHKFALAGELKTLEQRIFITPNYQSYLSETMVERELYNQQLAYFQSLDPYAPVESVEMPVGSTEIVREPSKFMVRLPLTLCPQFSLEAQKSLEVRMHDLLDCLEESVYATPYYLYHQLYVQRAKDYDLDFCEVNGLSREEFMYARFYSYDAVLLQKEWLLRRNAMLKYLQTQDEEDKVFLGHLLDPTSIERNLAQLESLPKEQAEYWRTVGYIYTHPSHRTCPLPLTRHTSKSLPPGVQKFMALQEKQEKA